MPEPEISNVGDHPWVDTSSDEQAHERAYLAKTVYDAEMDAIRRRREHITSRKRANCPLTGLALSGGGIRSASFGLGALQAFHAYFGIEGIDYLSTVSGGGYIGCSLTTALQKTDGQFPFTKPKNYDDTDSVRHIRDYSNYLIPHGALDVVTAIGLIGRGLIANTLIILPVLFLCVSVTLLIHPTVTSLGKPVYFLRYIMDTFPGIPLLPSLHAYWFTAILAALNLLFLTIWALFTSMNVGKSATLRGGWVSVSKAIFLVTLVTAF
ncbi:MAG TPA: patatin-like phospholipase family protein, partial [Methylocella sp.]|nr:patatin-like phospholipase family protein [Methylocella sp.]